MAKESVKQIKARLINELSAAHKNDIESYKRRIDSLIAQNKKLQEDNYEKRNTIDELKEKVRKYEDWIERMQDFCNMTEEERRSVIEEHQSKFEESGIFEFPEGFWSDYLKLLIH